MEIVGGCLVKEKSLFKAKNIYIFRVLSLCLSIEIEEGRLPIDGKIKPTR